MTSGCTGWKQSPQALTDPCLMFSIIVVDRVVAVSPNKN